MNADRSYERFKFKQFKLSHHNSTMKVGTDGVLLGAWANVSKNRSILDIGTGCGLIALMAAQRNRDGIIDAIDIDGPSVKEAKSNFESSPWGNRMNAFQSSLQNFDSKKKYDHILSNPPFFENGTFSPNTQRKKARHAITLSQNELVENVLRLLTEEGMLSVVIPYDSEDQFNLNSQKLGLFIIRKTLFYSKQANRPERCLISLCKKQHDAEETTLIHYNDDGSWTDEYKLLTKDYYIKL